MRICAEWVYQQEHWDKVPDSAQPSWIGFGFITADGGGLLLLIALILGGVRPAPDARRRQQRARQGQRRHRDAAGAGLRGRPLGDGGEADLRGGSDAHRQVGQPVRDALVVDHERSSWRAPGSAGGRRSRRRAPWRSRREVVVAYARRGPPLEALGQPDPVADPVGVVAGQADACRGTRAPPGRPGPPAPPAAARPGRSLEGLDALVEERSCSADAAPATMSGPSDEV